MKNGTIIVLTMAVLSLPFFSLPGYSYYFSDIEQFLAYNRTLNGNPYRLEDGENIDYAFMVDLIQEEIHNFNNLVDSYDNASNPSAGYTWDMKIFHPGETPGVLLPGSGSFPVIIVCKGMGGSSPWAYSYMDWLGEAYAAKGYVVAIPEFMNDDAELGGTTSFDNIRVSIFALQVSQTLDYLEEKFSASGRLNSDNTTMIGHSVGGWVSIRTACHESRVSRIAQLSAMYDKYYYLNVLDSFDIMRFLSSLPEADKPALHVQHYTQNSTGCPPVEPACDPVPIIDGWTTNVSEDLWLPFLCDGGDCGERTGTSNHYLLYDGPKQDGIRDNPYLTHSGGDTENGYPEVIRLLDEFFSEFPVDIPSDNNSVALVETRSTPGFDPPVFYLFGDYDGDDVLDDVDNCPDTPNPDQLDTYPPLGNGIGDACDCEGNFDCDQDVDAEDVTTFLNDFGRNTYSNPCINGNQCKGDFSCDGDVDAVDVTKFLEDFGRNTYSNPCPTCVEGDWCVYP